MSGKSWQQFEGALPDLAEVGRKLLYQGSDIASAFLATVDGNNGPRLHPIFPVIAEGELWLFIVNISLKYKDLVERGQFALHSQPIKEGAEEFYIRGNVELIEDEELKASIVAATDNRQGGSDFEALFRCRLLRILHTQWDGWGTSSAWPRYTKWRA